MERFTKSAGEPFWPPPDSDGEKTERAVAIPRPFKSLVVLIDTEKHDADDDAASADEVSDDVSPPHGKTGVCQDHCAPDGEYVAGDAPDPTGPAYPLLISCIVPAIPSVFPMLERPTAWTPIPLATMLRVELHLLHITASG